MIVEKIIYMETIPTGPYANSRLGIEGILAPGESIEEAFIQAKANVEASFKAMNPNIGEVHTYVTPTPETIQVEQRTPKEQQIANFAEAISTCTSLKALGIFSKLVERENNELLTTAFNNKLKEFQ